MRHWLFKSEPDCYSFTDLENAPGQTTSWDGVRNYQARNFMRDDMKKGDLGFFYHSGKNPEIAGIVEIVREGHPDITAQDPEAGHFDPKATPGDPRWYMVDVKLVRRAAGSPQPVAVCPRAGGYGAHEDRKPPFRTARGGRSLCRHRQAGGPARRGQGGGARGEGMSELLHSPDAELAALKARVARLERLEEQVYFQERTLSALNEAITLQQRQLDDLQGRMEAVEEKFRELWELVGNEGGEATVPPHYMKLA